MLPDTINSAFEGVAAVLLWLNVAATYRARCVRGVHWAPVTLFTAWGWWNLFYYPHLGQWLSFYAGIGVVIANTVWCVLLWKYWNE